MTDHTPSGQQAVEHCPRCGSVVENAAGIGPFCPNAKCDVADNLLCVPTFSTAAPTAPSTAAGEMAFVCGCGWDGSYADLNETVEGMTCPKCRLGRNLDCAAALATPPAQALPSPRLVSEEDGEHEAFILRYSDTEMRDEVFAGHGARDAAFRRFEQQAIAWTCGLFQRIRRTGGGPLATDPHATPPAQSPPWQEHGRDK